MFNCVIIIMVIIMKARYILLLILLIVIIILVIVGISIYKKNRVRFCKKFLYIRITQNGKKNCRFASFAVISSRNLREFGRDTKRPRVIVFKALRSGYAHPADAHSQIAEFINIRFLFQQDILSNDAHI